MLLGRLITKAGETGEMIVRSGSMTTGYWRGLELTAFNIRDGWSHTGDLAYKDIYWFVSRKSAIIHHQAGLVSPIEVEGRCTSIRTYWKQGLSQCPIESATR